ncbi:hypothetical protein ABZ438_20140 [Streptomyces sp. NPDC005786]|uniref:hypothetical protein n=1 Tax=unclassified Streptomyces TaxID=2593676 RepID=UPI0033CA929A
MNADDEILEQVRAQFSPGRLPLTAPPEAVAELEEAVGHPMPVLLKRIYLEVADGGFGRWGEALSLTDDSYSFSDSGPLLEEYLTVWRSRPSHPAPIVPLLTWGCAIWSFVDFSTPEGRMWGWDPNQRCLRHALFPEDLALAQRLVGWLNGGEEDYPQPLPIADCVECAPDVEAPSGVLRLK